MKKFFKILGIIILLVIVFLLVAGLFVSKTFSLQRDITIHASRETVWSHVSSLRSMEKWSPWVSKDPNMKTSFEGQDGSVGSIYRWDGNSDVGSGSQTLTKLDPQNRAEVVLNFIRPFKGKADTFVDLTDAGGGTKVTWGFQTTYTYPLNVMQLFFDMDEMMGKDYKAGLESLKGLSER